MANTYTLIASNTLSSSAASVTFSSIPNTYTDLVVKASVRMTVVGNFDELYLQFNSSTAAIHSRTDLYGNGTSAFSGRDSSRDYISLWYANASSSTTSTFTNIEYYIPSYTANQNKPVGISSASEANATLAYINATAGLFRSTSEITTIKIYPISANFASDSSFWLYGIKKD